MEIRILRREELQAALELVWEVFEEFEAGDYSRAGIAEFRKYIDYDSIIAKFNQGKLLFWGCFDPENLLGVIATRGVNHISLLFVRKEFHRQGIARLLLQEVIKDCLRAGAGKISVNSSPYAVEAYHHLGFVDTDSEQIINGIRFVPMVYMLPKHES